MRWLCIQSRDRGEGILIRAGLIYTEVWQIRCQCKVLYLAMDETPTSRFQKKHPRCRNCNNPLPSPPRSCWDSRFFIPWNPEETGVLEEQREKETADG